MGVGRINEVAALIGFPYEKRNVRFARQKSIGRNNEVAVRRHSHKLLSNFLATFNISSGNILAIFDISRNS